MISKLHSLLFTFLIMPTSFAQETPGSPIPQSCRVKSQYSQHVGTRTATYSNLDRANCNYQAATYSLPKSHFWRLCQSAVAAQGYDGSGHMSCEIGADFRIPRITFNRDCRAPERRIRTQSFYLTYTLSESDRAARKCPALVECLESGLTTKREIKAAKEWFEYLRCDQQL